MASCMYYPARPCPVTDELDMEEWNKASMEYVANTFCKHCAEIQKVWG